MTDLQLSYLRSAMKIVGGALVAHGTISEVDVATLSTIAEQLVGAGLAAYAMWQSHRVHA